MDKEEVGDLDGQKMDDKEVEDKLRETMNT